MQFSYFYSVSDGWNVDLISLILQLNLNFKDFENVEIARTREMVGWDLTKSTRPGCDNVIKTFGDTTLN